MRIPNNICIRTIDFLNKEYKNANSSYSDNMYVMVNPYFNNVEDVVEYYHVSVVDDLENKIDILKKQLKELKNDK